MKRLLFITILLSFPALVFGASFGAAREYLLRQGEVIEGDLYAVGTTATLVGSALGDVFLLGGNVFVGNSVSQSAFLIGGTVDIIGSVGQNLRIISGKTLFRGDTGEDFVAVSSDIQILPESVINGNLSVASGRAVIDGEVMGSLKGVVGELILNGKIAGDVDVTVDSVTLGPNALIEGSFSYSSPKQVVILGEGQILGEVFYTEFDTRSKAEQFLPTLWGTWIFVKLIILMVSALVMHGIFRSISNSFVERAVRVPGWSVVRGFVFMVAVPVALFVTALTLIGIPFLILGLSVYVGFLVLAYFFSPIIIGSVVFKYIYKTPEIPVNWKSIVTGVFLVVSLGFLGWIGNILHTILFLITLGAIYQGLFERFVSAREKNE